MAELPADLAAALQRATSGVKQDQLSAVTGRLIDRYQADHPAAPGDPIMAGDQEAQAYAAYRMPATYAAITAVLDQLPEVEPITHLDLAGGTGAAVWAVANRWASIEQHTVLEQAPAAITLGRALAAGSDHASVRETQWERVVFGASSGPSTGSGPLGAGGGPSTGSGSWGRADVVTIGYLLSEIDESLQQKVIRAAAESAGELLIIVEPGTTKGYRRIISARDQLLAAGMSLVAPCPHQLRCPLQDQDQDWCHFSARVNRSAAHRRAKGAELGYEDEKFSYLVAAPPTPIDATNRADNRVLRHPQYPKGRVRLELCRRDGTAGPTTIAKRDKENYRLARKIEWGDSWPTTDPPASSTPSRPA